jgi:hypothetical protein
MENLAQVKAEFAEAGLFSIDPSNPPTAEEELPIKDLLVRITEAFPPEPLQTIVAAQRKDPKAIGDINEPLRMWLFAHAHMWLAQLPSLEPSTLLDLFALTDAEELTRFPVLDEVSEKLDRPLAAWHSTARLMPYVLWGAIHTPALWEESELLTREVFLEQLILLGEESEAHAAAVLRVLEAPATFQLRLAEEEEHPTAWYGTKRLSGIVGFSKAHLDHARELLSRLTTVRETSDPTGAADPSLLNGRQAWRLEYAMELRGRVQLELLGQSRLVARLDRPDDVIAIWSDKRDRIPWPDLVSQLESYLGEMLAGKLTHGSDAELNELSEKKQAEGLTEEERKRWKVLDDQRYLDTRMVFRSLVSMVEPNVPPEAMPAFLGRLNQALEEAGRGLLSEQILLPAWESFYQRNPRAAKDLLDRLDGSNELEAIAALNAFRKPNAELPDASQALVRAASDADNFRVRQKAMQMLGSNGSAQEATAVFTDGLDTLTSADPRLDREWGRSRLSQGLTSLLYLRARNFPEESYWTRECLVQLFERELWSQPDSIGAAPQTRTWAARHLRDEQIAGLEAAGKLPTWVVEARR